MRENEHYMFLHLAAWLDRNELWWNADFNDGSWVALVRGRPNYPQISQYFERIYELEHI